MIKGLVTKTQALALKEMGFDEPASYHLWIEDDTNIDGADIMENIPRNSNITKWLVSVPTTDEVIDWLRRKYDIITYDRIEPFVDPEDKTHKTILFRYGVKRCDTKHLGWNGRVYLGATRLAYDVYSLKLEAIDIALEYIKSQQNENTKSAESPSS